MDILVVVGRRRMAARAVQITFLIVAQGYGALPLENQSPMFRRDSAFFGITTDGTSHMPIIKFANLGP